MKPTRSSGDRHSVASRALAGAAAFIALGTLAAACSSDKLEPVPTAPETVAPVGVTPTTRFVEPTTAPSTGGVTTIAGPSTSAGQTTATSPDSGLPPLTGFGIGTAMFDDPAEAAVQALTASFGTPTTDSGWIPAANAPLGTCPGQHVRGVRWGQLLTLYSDQGGAPHFFTYTYGLANREAGPALRTDVGIGLGSTAAQVQAAYPDAEIGRDASRGAYFVDEAAGISGSFDKAGAAGKVTRIIGGTPCGA